MTDTALSDQINQLIAETRRLRNKSDADDKTIHLLKEQNAELRGGIESLVEDHRRIERKLVGERDEAQLAYTEIEGLLNQAADCIMQAARARIGDQAPEKMPQQIGRHVDHHLLPENSPIARLAQG